MKVDRAHWVSGRVRVAVIGLGAVVRNIHLPAYSQLRDQVEVVGGCDIDPQAKMWAEKKWHLPAVYENPEEMIEKTKPDIVSVCTPPFLHHEQTLMGLHHGCHVFCEKPLADSLVQADEMIRVAEVSNRFVVVNSQFPYINIHMAAKEMIGSEKFGRLLFLHAWQTFHPTEETEAGWRKNLARRICFEFGVHVFELVRFFFGETPVKIMAHMPKPANKNSEAINIISMEFADGRAASMVLDRLSKGPERYLDMRLDGERAAIHTSIGGELRMEIGMHTRERHPFFGFNFAKGGKAVLQNGNQSEIIAKDGFNPLVSATATHFKNFLQAIQDGNVPPGTVRDHRNTLALSLAAYDAAESGKAIDLDGYLRLP